MLCDLANFLQRKLQRLGQLKVNVGLGADCCLEDSGHRSRWVCILLKRLLWHWADAGVHAWEAACSPGLAGNSSLASWVMCGGGEMGGTFLVVPLCSLT